MGEKVQDRKLMSAESGIVAFKHETKYINSKFICVDPSYQRELKPNDVKRIIKELDPNVERMPRVSSRGGKFYVFDGQHTVAMLKELNNGNDLDIECEVFYGMTKMDEALLFSKQRGHTRRLNIGEQLTGALVGGDEAVQDFKDLVESVGFICDFSGSCGDGKLVCYGAAYNVFTQADGPERLREILEIIKDSWGMDADGLRREIICGMNIVLRDNVGNLDRKRMVKKLQGVSPLSIIREGKEKTKGGNKRFAEKIVEVYNANFPTGSPKRLK